MATHRQSGIATAKDWPQRGPPAPKHRNMQDAPNRRAGAIELPRSLRPCAKHIALSTKAVFQWKEHQGQLPSTPKGPCGPAAKTRAIAPGIAHPTDGSGLPRRTDAALWVQDALPKELNLLQRAPPAKMAGSTSSCSTLLKASCVMPALRSPFLGCKGEAGMIAGHRPP